MSADVYLVLNNGSRIGSLKPTLGVNCRHSSLRLDRHAGLAADRVGAVGEGHIDAVVVPLADTKMPKVGVAPELIGVETVADGVCRQPPVVGLVWQAVTVIGSVAVPVLVATLARRQPRAARLHRPAGRRLLSSTRPLAPQRTR
jgi:hypothetical protein